MIKNLVYYIYYNTKLVLSYIGDWINGVLPDAPQKSIDIEDDWDEVEDTYDEIDIEDEIDEPDDFNPTKSVRSRSMERNRWGLPVIEEEQV